jgi:hypothetical protein
MMMMDYDDDDDDDDDKNKNNNIRRMNYEDITGQEYCPVTMLLCRNVGLFYQDAGI